MIAVVLRRLGGLVATLLLASVLIFAVLEILPGDPARVMLGPNATADAVDALREQLGLNAPLMDRYVAWVGGMLTGDMGRSLTYGTGVGALLLERATVSLPLAVVALLLTVSIALPVGLLAASRRGGRTDTTIMALAQLGIAVPNFWFAILLVYVFAVSLRWVPSGGFPGWDDPAGAVRTLVLPAVALAVPQAAILARVTRSALVEVLEADFVRTARAKGASRRHVLWAHALRNALMPVVTITGLQFAFLLSGVVIIEQVFSLPGLGRLAVQAITQADLPVVRGVVVTLVAVVVITNFVVDLLYAVIDPRLRLAAR